MPQAAEHDQTFRARHWPDRSAHRHRKRAHRLFYAIAVVVLVLPWFGYRHMRDAIRGEPAAPVAAVASTSGGAPAGPAIPVRADDSGLSGHMSAVRTATAAGDMQAIRTSVDAMNDASRQALPLVDRGRSVDREAARVAVQQLPGVRAAGWIDRARLLVVVARNDPRAHVTTIETVCRRLQPVGDTMGVVVSVQGDAAGRGHLPRETSRRCPEPGERIVEPATQSGPSMRQAAVPADALRGQGEAAGTPAEGDAEDRSRNEESMRILEETTPEM